MIKATTRIRSLNFFKLLPLFSLLGPGLLVMLADTDAGSLILSAQCGALWGYKLLFLQFLLIPVLYIVQELAVRLGLATGMGHGELIKNYYGVKWAWLSVSTLVICCIGALLTEFSGLIAVGELFNIPNWQTMLITVTFLIVIAWSGSYHSIERIAILLGFFELTFIIAAWYSRPIAHDILQANLNIPWSNSSFLYLMGSTIGAVIMPWMIFFQQSAVLDKGLSISHLREARMDTAVGAVITQLIMAATLMMTAATLGKINPNTSLNTAADISHALTPILGAHIGRILFALGMIGAALVATIVVTLTAAWGIGEITGFRRSLEDHPFDAPWFYGIYTIILIFSACLVTSHWINLVNLSVAIEMMNTLLLPIVLGFLFLLAYKILPEPYRLKNKYAWVVGFLLVITSGFGIITGLIGICN